MIQEPTFEESSGNVFADLGLDDAEELFTRGQIGIQVIRLLKQRHLKQDEISEILGISQSEVSHLMNGEFQRFSEGKLLSFLKQLDIETTLQLSYRNGENQDIETASLEMALSNYEKVLRELQRSHLEMALSNYEKVLQELQDSQPPKQEQVLAVLIARHVVETAWSQSNHISLSLQQQLLELDNILREQAHRITKTKGVNLSQYRKSFSPPEKAWWWRLETEVPPHFWDRWDWLWRGLTVACWTANLGLLVDIVPRFIGAGTGLLGTIAVAFPSLLTLLQARSELTQTGKEGFNRLLKRLRIPEHFHEEARFGSTALLLLLLVIFRANFPAFSDLYNKEGLKKYQEGEFAGAESAYQQALAINPDNFTANYNLGVLYEDLQEFDKAKTQYQLAVKGNLITAQNNQAHLHILEDKPDLAIPLLFNGLGNLANEDNPSLKVTHDLYKNLGWAFWKQEQTELAEKFLKIAIQLGESPEGIEQIQNRGAAHCLLAQLFEEQSEKQAEAVEQWQQCCQLGSVLNPDETKWLSLAHKKLKEVGKSCDGESLNL